MIYVFLADGFEETEAVAPIDILKRANIDVQTASVKEDSLLVKGAHGITLQCDELIKNVKIKNDDGIFLPGGMPGTQNLKNSFMVKHHILAANKNKNLIFAICAAPTVLYDLDILKGKKVTSFPALKETFKDSLYIEEDIVQDDNIITSKGVGTALKFGLYMVETISSKELSHKIAKEILYSS